MEQVIISTKSSSYPVYVDSKILSDVGSILGEKLKAVSKVLIITDDQIAPLYLETIINALDGHIEPYQFIVPRGESSKSFDQYYNILTFALENGLDRKSMVIALGGGVIGDLAGFVAATYMRGIKFVQVPTTLLAHDSSVGGKVGINHELGKNMIGAFYQPEAVIYDVSLLHSLNKREWASGFAEVIKHGFLSGEKYYNWLKASIKTLPITDDEILEKMLVEAIKVKASIVEEDEQEKGVRAYLNLGHTLGHAIEATAGYGKITHGEAVAIGMIFAMELSNEILGANLPVQETKEWFIKLSLPISIPDQCDHDKILKYMKRDKKNENGQINMVLLKAIGQPTKRAISEDEIKNAIFAF